MKTLLKENLLMLLYATFILGVILIYYIAG